MRVSGFDLILSMDFLTKVQNFFVSALKSTEDDVDVEIKPKVTKAASPSFHSVKSAKSVPSETAEKNFAFNLQLEKPDVVLVETMGSIDTNCVILNVSAYSFFLNL